MIGTNDRNCASKVSVDKMDRPVNCDCGMLPFDHLEGVQENQKQGNRHKNHKKDKQNKRGRVKVQQQFNAMNQDRTLGHKKNRSEINHTSVGVMTRLQKKVQFQIEEYLENGIRDGERRQSGSTDTFRSVSPPPQIDSDANTSDLSDVDSSSDGDGEVENSSSSSSSGSSESASDEETDNDEARPESSW